MANELTQNAKKEIQLSSGQQLQVKLLSELEKSANEMGQDFTDYGKKCVINAIAGLVTICKSQNIDLKSLDPTLLRLSLQNIGYTELNYSAIPSEIYFDLRKNGDSYVATIKPQGAGNEKLTRKYGVGLEKDTGLKSPWLVREGDEFTYPSFNGTELTPPTWKPKSLDRKVIIIVYPAKKIDGTTEYLMASRESIKANIIAQIRQNSMYKFKIEKYNKKGEKYYETDYAKRDEFYKKIDEEFEKLTVDEILRNEEWLQYVNPTYTSGGSKEQMIIRKMKNNALKNYPKEYDTAYVKDAVENMFEDKDDTLFEKKDYIETDVVEKVENEINEKPKEENAIQDFSVDENGEVINEKEQPKEEQPKKEQPEKEQTVIEEQKQEEVNIDEYF